MNTPTPSQQAAIVARGNVLVVAGAGAGKTRTLVDRCLAWLLDSENPGSVDQMLMVTFTEAAAAEMRQRLRARLEAAQAENPSRHLAEQLALLETAWICTLHSFCFSLARENFYALGLDPQLIVLPDERAHLLAREALDDVLERNYTADTPPARAIQETIQAQGGDSDVAVRALVMRLHHYAQTLPDPAGWFDEQTARFQQSSPEHWREWLLTELEDRRREWGAEFRAQAQENPVAQACAAALARLGAKPARAAYAEALDALAAAETESKPKWRKPLENIFTEARFLRSVCATGETDPLTEDWQWSAPAMLTLLDLTRQFDAAYRDAKREAGGLDFHDLEQFALRLLYDEKAGQPSALASRWRARLRLIFVDEYQDINHAQDAIIRALGRADAAGNRFLVGDIKQSIYRFRLADPRIFLQYQRQWERQPGAAVLSLSDNFRSHPDVLNFVNGVFEKLMRKELGGIDYDEKARLHFGNPPERAVTTETERIPRVELLLCRLGRNEDEDGGENAEAEMLSQTEKEARLLGRRLTELKNQEIARPGHPSRPAAWSDMVVLLRSPRHKVEAYVKEFARQGIPLAATRGGFYESLEVRDLLSLLQILDNPAQDLPLLGVLRSPLVGLTADELAAIRLARRPARLWEALLCWREANPGHERVNSFLQRYRAWRRLSRVAGVSQLLDTIVAETGFGQFTTAQAGLAVGADNIARLLYLTRQFDEFRGEGLYRFLQFVQAQQENEIEVEPAGQPLRDAVRLMSIHQSKGLEFPIVALPDLGKRFNLDDTRGRVILDEEFGLCPQVKPPGRAQFYPSLPYWLAQRRQKRETLGEELRLLYVALTRAAGRLILCGSARDKTISGKWTQAAERGLGTAEILAGQSFLDWLGSWILLAAGPDALEQAGAHALLTWNIISDYGLPPALEKNDAPLSADAELDVLRRAQPVVEWRYKFDDATRRAAKTSVSALRRELTEEEDDETEIWLTRPGGKSEERRSSELSASEIGSAHHAFLEAMALAETGSVARLKEEAARLQREGHISEAQVHCLDFKALAGFWQSPTGREVLAQRDFVKREVPFTARFSPGELDELHGRPAQDDDGEFVIVQGVADLAVIMPNEIWLLDFKTDWFDQEGLQAKVELYRSQLILYALALGRIYGVPVTRRWLHFFAVGKTVEVGES